MSGQPQSGHARGLELAGQGRHDEALAAIQEHLIEHPDDGQALNDAGAILFGLGRFEEAARNLRRAVEGLGAEAQQALENLAEAHLAAGQGRAAWGLFDDLTGTGRLTPDMANRAAVLLLEADDKRLALDAMARSLQLAPQQADIREIADKLRTTQPRVTIVTSGTGGENFADIRAFLEARHPVRGAVWQSDQDTAAVTEAVASCDVAWVETCLPVLPGLAGGRHRCRILCRVGPRDAAGPFCTRVPWENVAAVLFRGERDRQNMVRSAPLVAKAKQTILLPPAVDLSDVAYQPRPWGKKLAWVASNEDAASPALLVQCLHTLRKADAGWTLQVAGELSAGTWQYFQSMLGRLGLADAVTFDGWQADLGAWLQDKDVLAAARTSDDWRADVLLAFAAGVRPLVHAFPGSEEFAPPECLFATEEEFAARARDGALTPAECRRFAQKRFALPALLKTVFAAMTPGEA